MVADAGIKDVGSIETGNLPFANPEKIDVGVKWDKSMRTLGGLLKFVSKIGV